MIMVDNNFSTKYRPRTYNEVVGQDVPKAVLKKIAASEGIACRSIFLKGSWGSGKTTLARIFAKSMNCKVFKKTGDVCNECSGCLDTMATNSQVYMEFDATTAGNIDAIRALHDRLAYLPQKNMRRVVVLDEVHACVDYRTPIATTEGNIEAKKLVDDKLNRTVTSYNYATGKIEERPIIAHYNNGSCEGVEWYRCQWNGGVARVTGNHEFFLNGVPTRVDSLSSEFYADCIDYKISTEAEQVLIGTLLGDSTLVTKICDLKGTARSKALSRVENTYAIQMMQGEDQLEYLRWKEEWLGELFANEVAKKRACKNIYCAYSKTSPLLGKYKGLHNTRNSYKDVASYLKYFGPLTWLVWYLDDGHYDSKNEICTISCTNIGISGADAVIKYAKTLGFDLRKTVSVDKRSNKKQIRLYFTKVSTKKFLEYISGYIDVEQIKYKIPASEGSCNIVPITKEYVPCGRKVLCSRYYPSKKFETVRYNISVEETENYTLPGGLLTHNCSSSALNALLKLVEEGVPSTIFVFCSTEDILPTLKSRSICLDIMTIPPSVMATRVKEVADKEGIKISDGDIDTICFKSKGHMRDALSLLQLYSFAGSEVLKTPYDLLVKFIFACLKKDRMSALAFLSEILNYPTTDIRSSLSGVIKNAYIAGNNDRLYPLLKSGLVSKVFSFFYSPVSQQALKSEVGAELLLRSFLEKTNPHE